MYKKRLAVLFAVLLGIIPAAAQAEIVIYQVHRSANHGEFAHPVGVFNAKLGIAPRGEFITRGIISKNSILKDQYSGQLKNSGGVFGSINTGKEESSFGIPHGTFNSAGLISGGQKAITENDSFKSPSQGEFKFYLPKA